MRGRHFAVVHDDQVCCLEQRHRIARRPVPLDVAVEADAVAIAVCGPDTARGMWGRSRDATGQDRRDACERRRGI